MVYDNQKYKCKDFIFSYVGKKCSTLDYTWMAEKLEHKDKQI